MSINKVQKEINAVKKLIIDYYYKAQETRNPKFLEELIHNQWRFFLFNEEGSLRIVDKNEYFKFFDPTHFDKVLVWSIEFLFVDITENIGAIKLKIENQQYGFIDYFQLMKIDKKWWIVHKLSHKFIKEDSSDD